MMFYGNSVWQEKADWKLQFCWIPRRCKLSGRWIWFDLAYKGELFYDVDDSPHSETRWHDAHEHLIWQLKR